MSTELKDQDDDFMSLDTLTNLGRIEDIDNANKLTLDTDPDEDEDKKKADEKKEDEELEEEDIKVVEVPKSLVEASDDFKNTLGELFGKNAFGTLEIENETGEVEEVEFKDAIVDHQTFVQLAANRIKEIEEEAQKDRVSTENMSEFLMNMIEIEKNGGETQKLFSYHDAYIKPLDGMDLETITDQRKAAVMGLRLEGKTDEDIEIMITGWEGRGILESKAKDYDTRIRALVEGSVQAEKDVAKKAKVDGELKLVEFKKEVKSKMTQFELNDKAKERLVNFITKPDEKGRFDIDKAFEQKRLDPEQASLIALLLLDKEEFIKQVTKEAVRDKQLEIGKRIKISRQSGVPSVKSKSKNGEEDDFIELPTMN